MSAIGQNARIMEHQFIAQLASLAPHGAAAMRRAMLSAAGRDLVWREGREQAAEAFYLEADILAAGDLSEKSPTGAFALPAPPAGGDEAPSSAVRRLDVRRIVHAGALWLSGFAAGFLAAAVVVSRGMS